jgi:dihydrofolate synthase / folylpolyglutamate synthase
MDYHQTLDWLFGLEANGIKFGLENITVLLGRLGNPQLSFFSIHVGGTNGKGSVCALLSRSLREQGYKVGLYTSPHIVDFGERIQVNGDHLREREMLRLTDELRSVAEEMEGEGRRMTFFELTTAMAFRHFQKQAVEVAVVEVGMGGRLDATNVLLPRCSIITRVGLEHTDYLGKTVEKIAYEKAGIIKSGVPVITAAKEGQGLEVIARRASALGAPLLVIEEGSYSVLHSDLEGTTALMGDGSVLFAPLPGRYQGENMALAYACLNTLDSRGILMSREAIVEGFAHTYWPGRLESINRSPRILLDATHTADGARVIARDLPNMVGREIILVLGVLNDKDLDGMAGALGPLAKIAIATSPNTKRAFSATQVETALKRYCPQVLRIDDVAQAASEALRLASKEDVVVITGSLYTIGEARRWWDSRETGGENSRPD